MRVVNESHDSNAGDCLHSLFLDGVFFTARLQQVGHNRQHYTKPVFSSHQIIYAEAVYSLGRELTYSSVNLLRLHSLVLFLQLFSFFFVCTGYQLGLHVSVKGCYPSG